MRVNKEKVGATVRFSVRLPKEQHEWLKELSNKSKRSGKYMSMNDYITRALAFYKNNLK